MLRVFLYEFLTAGGCWALGNEPPTGSLLREGRAMRDALASDLAAVPNVDCVWLMHDNRLPSPQLPKLEFFEVRSVDEERRLFQQLSATADATLIIAPEFSDVLLQRVLLAEQVLAQLISPGSQLVRLAADKSATMDLLAARRLPVPRGNVFRGKLPEQTDFVFPAVLKPNDGAGSGHVRRVNDREELGRADLSRAESWRLEQFVPGLAASVAILAGPRELVPLQPCFQHLSDDGRFTYLGGSTPLPSVLANRAKRLAIKVAETLPKPRGYLGIDMVLGSAENGTEDAVIEINPRLTTSYLGLRQACEQNLAAAMLQCVRGETMTLSYRQQQFDFTPETVRAATC